MNTPTQSPTPVADYFSDPKRHTKGEYSRDKSGDGLTNWSSVDAECHCLAGKVYDLYSCNKMDEVFSRLEKAIQTMFWHRISMAGRVRCAGEICVEFNDHPDTTAADVYAVCKEAGV